MDFELSEDQQMMRDMARDFAQKELLPIARKLDEECIWPTDILKKMGQLGFLGMTLPEEYDGAEMDPVSYALAIEEISRGDASCGAIMSIHNSLVGELILKYGTEDQKSCFLPQLARGQILGCFALTEPGAGSDAGSITTAAVEDGDSYVLNGTKIFISGAAYADLVILFASTDRTKGSKGISVFIIPKGTPGLEVGTVEHKMGLNASGTSELVLTDCRVSKELLLGQRDNGFKIALAGFDAGRIGIASQSVGIARGALEESIEYAKQREQFGKTISSFQAVQWMIAEMATQIDAARLLYLRAAHVKSQGKRFSKEAAMAKLFASETCVNATRLAVQVHGGYGYMKEYAVERYYREAKITEIYEGTSEVMKMIISAALLA
ncbi:MAG: acyl-CoA dehydrogenase family protein [Candidatus Coatesbacteria bacterium]|nr:acyl-CoA dehydrogenase family protein [Candidatus Coatesbacteria bacterium]